MTTAVEHSAVLEAANRAGRVTMAGVDGLGRVDPATVLAGIRSGTVLVSVQLANHEVGTVQPAAEVVAGARERGVLTHVDACAAAGHLPIDFAALGADLCSVTAHKLGGPRGIGALLVRRGLRAAALPPRRGPGAEPAGRDRERRRRRRFRRRGDGTDGDRPLRRPRPGPDCGRLPPGTNRLEAEAEAARILTDRLLIEAPKAVDGLAVFGDPVDRLPHLVCFGVEGVEAEPVLLGLDQHGVAVHSGSSCSSETFEPSPVLSAMGVDADHSLRVSVGWSSTAADVDAFLAALPAVISRLRSLRSG